MCMAEEKPSLHIDTDWKKQAQEEKKRLAEQASQTREPLISPAPAMGAAAPRPGAAAEREGQMPGAPQASFATLVQGIMTQVFFYLGELATRGAEPMINFDMAKYQMDHLTILEEKTKGNLNEKEQKLIDTALYETRMRFVSVASQFIS